VLSGEIFSYDAMGRVIKNWQCGQSNCGVGAFLISAGYDLAGNLTSTTDGAGTTISYTYNGASEISTAASSLNDAQHPGTLLSGVGYYPHSAIQLASFGNGLSETFAFNSRLQPCRVELNSGAHYFNNCGDPERGGNVIDFTIGYNAGTTDNGNVVSWSAVGNQTFNRTYTYDPLNRIQNMTDSVTTQACQGLSWTIDAWGNMTSQTTTAGSCLSFSTSSPGTKNQLATYTYDSAGNTTYDGNHHYTYDAEGRITQVDSGGTASYVYNENGTRVRKNTGSTFTEYYYGPNGAVQGEFNGSTWPAEYVYAGNRLIAEYKNSTTEFVHPDHLGTTRLVTSVTGTVVDSLDFLPYGVQTLGDTATTHKFTGKERDAESGLDNFGARYHASSLGRFMTPDPLHIMKQKLIDPQQWNMYAYVRNNPLRFTDPTGMYTCSDNNKCKSGQYKDFEKARQRDLKSKDSAVVAAAKAYGDPTKDNGVSVKFGDPGKGHDGSTAASVVYADGKFQGKVDVTIKSGLSGTALDAAVGHEGVHVGDAQGYFSTINGGQSDMSKDLTHSQTEMNAYRVTASIWAASGNTASYGQCGGGSCNYGPGMTAGQIDATTMILLSNPANGYNEFVEDGNYVRSFSPGDDGFGQGSFVNVLGLPMVQ
jgi:RHS repeat-associated protein